MSNVNQYTKNNLIITSKKFGEIIVILDNDKIELAKKYTWNIMQTKGHVTIFTNLKKNDVQFPNKRTLSLGQLIIWEEYCQASEKEEMVVTYRNGNSLDCRSSNLCLLPFAEHRRNTNLKTRAKGKNETK